MALAKFRKVHSRQGAGRFVVSEGIAPSEYLLPHEGLPTLYYDLEDDRFEIVLTKGALLSLVTDDNGDSRIVPANGSGTDKEYEFSRPGDFYGAPAEEADGVTLTVPANSTVIGAAQYDLYRPFDKGTSQGAGWITHGYVEWPLVDGLNEDLEAGDLVVSDDMGRPVKATGSPDVGALVGKVIAVEKFATNFDDGLLSYMQLPSDPGAVKEVYSLTKPGDYQGKLGIRANLNVENVVGAVRVNLNL